MPCSLLTGVQARKKYRVKPPDTKQWLISASSSSVKELVPPKAEHTMVGQKEEQHPYRSAGAKGGQRLQADQVSPTSRSPNDLPETIYHHSGGGGSQPWQRLFSEPIACIEH